MDSDLLYTATRVTLPHLPVVAACLVGCAVAGACARRMAGGAVWAVLGFAIAAVIALLAPASQLLVRDWGIQRALPLAQMSKAFTALGVLWSLLSTISFGMLVAGMIVGRPPASTLPLTPPPFPMVPGPR